MLTRVELAVGAALVLGLAAFGRPIVETLVWRTRRAEVPWLLDDLRDQWIASGRVSVAAGPWPQGAGSVGAHQVSFSMEPSGGFWRPSVRSARGSYRIEVGAKGVRFVGICDVDGDGQRAVYVATPEAPAERVTAADVY